MAPREEPETVYPSASGPRTSPYAGDIRSPVTWPRTPADPTPAPNRLGDVAHSIYICSAEGNAGKSTVALGTLDTLSRRAARVGVFRPIARSREERDYVLDLLLAHEGVIELSYDEAIGVGYDDVHIDPEAALATIVRRFK